MAQRISRYQQEREVNAILRGEIYLVSFDPTVGHEIRKTRPALIIQNNVGNQYSPLTIVAAITSKVSTEAFPVEVILDAAKATGLSVRSSIRLDQIRTIDHQRLVKRLGAVDGAVLRKVDEAIKISLGLVEI